MEFFDGSEEVFQIPNHSWGYREFHFTCLYADFELHVLTFTFHEGKSEEDVPESSPLLPANELPNKSLLNSVP